MLENEVLDRDRLGRLSAEAIDDPATIERILRAAWLERAPLSGWTARSGILKPGAIEAFEPANTVRIHIPGHNWYSEDPILLDCRLAGRLYFFSVRLRSVDVDYLTFSLPNVIYVGERRDRSRTQTGMQQQVVMFANDREVASGEVLDRSPGGLGVSVPFDAELEVQTPVLLRYPGKDGERDEFGEVRSVQSVESVGWKRIGLLLLPTRNRGRVASEWRADQFQKQAEIATEAGGAKRSRRGIHQHASNLALIPSDPTEVPVVAFENSRHERIMAILDICGDPTQGPTVVIPPAWGKTKETLLSLSAVIQAAFRSSGQSVSVLRFDGVRRRGESHNDSDCAYAGLENLRFTFSQAVEDLRAAVKYVRSRLKPSSVIVVTFSAASIEGRRVVADDAGKLIDGWISVVGAPDPQALIRSLTGGVDYFAGYESGRRFGRQEIQGLSLDIDNAARDAIENRLAFLEDARADLARISVPVTWIHGEHDAWLEVDRVRDVLSVGDTKNRRLIVLPTGHQLRNSREALEAFNLIAGEVARMGLRKAVAPGALDPRWLSRRRKAERSRLNRKQVDVRGFWRAYLLGRGTEVGVELVANTDSYRGLMRDQVEALDLRRGQRVVDLGCGVGMFARHLLESDADAEELRIVAIDYVREALHYARKKLNQRERTSQSGIAFVVGDLDSSRERRMIPIASESVDRGLASLVINYLQNPAHLLEEVWRVLRPNGVFVVSSLKEDADTSRICVRGVGELRAGTSHRVFDEDRQYQLDHSLRGFISDAGRLIDFEEQGVFRFWSEQDLIGMLEGVGFQVSSCRRTFGDPAQALLMTAVKP